MAGQISRNTHKKPNKIFAVKPLLKTAKVSQFGKRPSSQPEIFSAHVKQEWCVVIRCTLCEIVLIV